MWELVERRACATPDLLCLADEHGRRLTWAELHAWIERTAAGLHELGITSDRYTAPSIARKGLP